ncbi:MAG: hypothetical protein HN884_13315 [Rhodospirillaceae bacterium]|nr:hypothetical protein [Rhodospirillaceae bacterium]MBT7267849.1 hypothetical protein [Rhodospirillaceae bacterium]
MPHRIKIEHELNCVFIQHYGDVDAEEVLEQVKALGNDPNFSQGMNLLRDFSQTKLPANYGLDRFKTGYDRWIKNNDQLLGSRRKVAWVLKDKEDFITIHQFCVVTRLNNMVADRKPFRDMANARKFLEIPDEYVIEYPKLP